MTISRKEIRSFEDELHNLRQSIRFFNGKTERCVLNGIIDLAHSIESNIERLDSEIARIVNAETTAVEEIRNVRLHDNLSDLKRQYKIIKTSFENDCICKRR